MPEIHSAGPNGEIIIARLPDEPGARVITPREFLARLTPQKQAAIAAAAVATPALLVWLLQLVAAQEVDLDHADTVAGLAAVQAAGLLTAQEVAAIRA